MPMISEEMGKIAVQGARDSITSHLAKKESKFQFPPYFDHHAGAFVTLRYFPSGDLRGCIGYPDPVMPLKFAIADSARGASRDPRFHLLSRDELENITVEVTILTTPEPIIVNTPLEIPDKIRIGVDGLMIEKDGHRGLFLPQVPLEWGWGVEEYLENLCLKAGLPRNSWKQDSARLWHFSGEIFAEIEPMGVIEKKGLV